MDYRKDTLPYPWQVGAVRNSHLSVDIWRASFFWHGHSRGDQVCIIEMRTGKFHWCPCHTGANWVEQLSEPFDTFEECAVVAAFINKCSANT